MRQRRVAGGIDSEQEARWGHGGGKKRHPLLRQILLLPIIWRSRSFCSLLFPLLLLLAAAASSLFVVFSNWGCGRMPYVSGRHCFWAVPPSVESNFIFVYDLPRRWNRDLIDQARSRGLLSSHPQQQQQHRFLQLDASFFSLLQRSNLLRTTQPEDAALFFVPLLPALFYQLQLPADGAATAGDLAVAAEKTGQFVEEALQYVKKKHNFWQHSSGRDHFLLLSHPFGRCGLLSHVNPSHLGSLFAVLPTAFVHIPGNVLSSAPSLNSGGVKPADAGEGGDISDVISKWRAKVEAMACSLHGVDVVFPPLLPGNFSIVKPQQHNRGIDFLLPLDESEAASSASWVHDPPFERASVRTDLADLVSRATVQGWDVFKGSFQEATLRMQISKFCACLPDASYWREFECFVLAVISGCIPVTFFHSHLHPWRGQLAFRHFSLNFDPPDVFEAPSRLEVVLLDESRLWQMQSELEHIQPFFVFSQPTASSGQSSQRTAIELIIRGLQNRASEMHHGIPYKLLS